MVFSIIFGIALAQSAKRSGGRMLAFCESLSETMFKFTNIVMLFAPIGVAGAMAYTVGTMGFGVMGNLVKLLLTLYAALIVFVLCVLLPIALIARLPIKRFIKAVAEPASIAFATASSEAALPRAMETWKPSACRGRSSLLLCRPDTASISTAVRSICRSHPSLSLRPQAFI